MQTFDEAECHLLADFFALFSNPTRLRMFCALQGGRKTVSELAEYADVTMQNASQHLRLMRDKGAVTTEKEGQHVYYAVIDPRFLDAARLIRVAVLEAVQRKAGVVGAGPNGAAARMVHESAQQDHRVG